MTLYQKVNLELIAKAISELSYEEILAPKYQGNKYVLTLKSGVIYSFEGTMGIWDYITINPQTITRLPESQEGLKAAQFFIDTKEEHGMNEIILANFLEEMNNTLYSDMMLATKKVSSEKAATLSDESLQAILNGHPKILLNKGRIGWGKSDLEKYSPESSTGFQLVWLAVKKELTKSSFNLNYEMDQLLSDAMNSEELSRFNGQLKEKGIDKNEYYFVPSHPWQFDRFISVQFIEEFDNKTLINLGVFGDIYKPQISLRTLANQSRPGHLDIKLPLTILNTSAIRGLTTKYIKAGPVFSNYIQDICKNDKVLGPLNTDVLKEVAGIGYISAHFEKVEKAPYRYHEYLGATWRESALSKNKKEETSFMTGSLFYVDENGKSLIGEFIKRSGLETKAWLKEYFRHVVIPLYHLQTKYGLGLVAHGQNTVLKLKNFTPTGVYLKDFGGDLRIAEEKLEFHSSVPEATTLNKLPAHYLIHDLVTGHFVTVLRFVSAIMRDHDNFPEVSFYRVLAETVEDYQKTANVEISKPLNLLNEKIHRVLLNAVRFKIGYADSSERPVPMLGTDIINPLFIGLKSREEDVRL